MNIASFYRGILSHRRVQPAHSFRRDLLMACVDVSEIDSTAQGYVRLAKFLPLGIRRKDHLPAPDCSLAQRVREVVHATIGSSPSGQMVLLSQPRAFGLTFNPVSFVFCFEPGTEREIECVVAEVTNTPWGERYAYVLTGGEIGESGVRHFSSTKALHVSPFFGMDHEYDFGFSIRENEITLSIVNLQAEQIVFDVSLSLERIGEARSIPLHSLARHALMPFETLFGIYVQAIRLAIKRTPFFVHPGKGASNKMRGPGMVD